MAEPADSSRTALGSATSPCQDNQLPKQRTGEKAPKPEPQIRDQRASFARALVEKLRSCKGHPLQLTMSLTASEVKRAALYAREKFMLEPGLLELEPPLVVVGDIHGQFSDLVGIFEENGDTPGTRYLFLGDYVDRGPFQTETILLLLAYKTLFAAETRMLRGNHETREINKVYGFFDELKQRFGKEDAGLWELYQSVFSCLPLCARVGRRIFCMHGGISRKLSSWKQLQQIRKPLEVPDHGIISDLLWADPNTDTQGYAPSPRGVSWTFGEEACKEFCRQMDLDLVIRAHEMMQDGYEFFANRHLVTIFSAPYYCQEFDNAASVLVVDRDLKCMLRIRHPVGIKRKIQEDALQQPGVVNEPPVQLDPPDRSRLPPPPKIDQ